MNARITTRIEVVVLIAWDSKEYVCRLESPCRLHRQTSAMNAIGHQDDKSGSLGPEKCSGCEPSCTFMATCRWLVRLATYSRYLRHSSARISTACRWTEGVFVQLLNFGAGSVFFHQRIRTLPKRASRPFRPFQTLCKLPMYPALSSTLQDPASGCSFPG